MDRVRAMGIDVGQRRIGLAVSDASGVLATPWRAIPCAGAGAAAADAVAAAIASLGAGDDPVGTLVVGLPRRLDGSPTALTPVVEAFAARLGQLTGLPVVLQDERLTSREAESRLAVGERDWRKRKARLDAAAAAIILQDYLDARRPPAAMDDHHPSS